MKVALSHDWLNGMRGGEKCLEIFCEFFPDSRIYTLFYEKGKVSETIAAHPIVASGLQRFPGIQKSYRNFLPLFPWAVESLSVEGVDLLLSTSHCVAKGIRKPKGAVHICYCFTPMRYAWTHFDDYFGGRGALTKRVIRFILERLKRWDLAANAGVDRFVAISEHVRRRIREHYGRESDLVYPPADTRFYTPDGSVEREDAYLVVSALVPYKRIDVAVSAFTRMKRRLVVVGEGPEKEKLRRMAGPTVSFEGWRSDEHLRECYRRAKALIFPGEEDFGIVPVEAQSCGAPVIALSRGGALETVVDRQTGLFFEEPTVESLTAAVEEFERLRFDPRAARANAERFSRERFKQEMANLIRSTVKTGGCCS